jgi:predicted dehydrogenase
LENCWVLPESAPNLIDLKCEIVGSLGTVYVDGSHHRILQRYTQDEASYPDVFVCPIVYEKPMGFAAESIRYFADCITSGQVPMVGAEDGLKATRVLCAIQQSVREGQPIELPS